MAGRGVGREAPAACLPPAPQGPREHVLWEAVSGRARGRRRGIPHPPPVFLTPERVHSARNKSKGSGGLQGGVKRGHRFAWAQGKGGNQILNGASGFLRRCRSSQQPKPHLPPPLFQHVHAALSTENKARPLWSRGPPKPGAMEEGRDAGFQARSPAQPAWVSNQKDQTADRVNGWGGPKKVTSDFGQTP